MFKYSKGEVQGRSMGCQASMGENTGSWEGSQDLLGASLIWALLMSVMGPEQYDLLGGIRKLERIRSRKEKPSRGSWEGLPALWCGGPLMKESPSH